MRGPVCWRTAATRPSFFCTCPVNPATSAAFRWSSHWPTCPIGRTIRSYSSELDKHFCCDRHRPISGARCPGCLSPPSVSLLPWFLVLSRVGRDSSEARSNLSDAGVLDDMEQQLGHSHGLQWLRVERLANTSVQRADSL
ncbi:hypothetical protein BR93DRAFT_925010 [Coniochaeta sp. PMI_546]|nr:hypothetical protein BR93DRAFT_925010 [Coniochaeta sp. PMI_546]